MKIPMSWIKAYVDINVSTQEFADAMTMSGSKVETIEYVGKDFCNVVVGKIIKIEKHPNADKLVVCQIDIGEKTIQIVTGATNVQEGNYVPVALDGAILAGQKKIKNSTLRGVDSQGMLCSIEELGYSQAEYPEAPEDGIYIFQQEFPLGGNALEILEIKEDTVEFEITSNRPDCYSVIGLAREAAAIFDTDLHLPEISVKSEAGVKEDATGYVSVEVADPDLCRRYVARVVKNVKIAPSPQWMRHRLSNAGIRPINNIVDITNYVMLELGQPLHAFDANFVDCGKIIVRRANQGETITTLDGVVRELDSEMLVIADPKKPIAIAGIMGGENSKVTDGSAAVIFESANFGGTNIRLSAKRLGMRTEASSKYEKNLDPNISVDAVNRCVQLVEELGCGEVIKGIVDCYPNIRNKHEVKYSHERINALLGTELSSDEMVAYLKRLSIESTGNAAIIPTFRPDLELEADIAEEIARIYGYNNIVTTLSAKTPTAGKRNKKQIIEDLIKNTMTALGFSEAFSYSFESPRVFDMLQLPIDSDLRNAIEIKNPLGKDYSILRTNTLNGMLSSISTNYNRRIDEAMLFELSKIYLPEALPLTELPKEVDTLSIAFFSKDKYKDFYYLKGVCEELFDILGVKIRVEPEKGISFMHPGRCAKFIAFGKELGFLGEVHPLVTKAYDIGTKVYTASIDCNIIYERANLSRVYAPLPKYPASTKDIAMLVEDEILSAQIENIIRKRGGRILEDVKLFDVYKGSQIANGMKSMAYSISFRASDRTLTDQEISEKMSAIIFSLEKELGATLRDK